MLVLNCLGPMTLLADGAARPLPSSRKTRALLAFLALEPRPHSRERLCELLWDIPDDPRAALRWSLTKLRPLLDRPDRLQAGREDVALLADDLVVDVAVVRAVLAGGLGRLPPEQLEALFIAANQGFLAASDVPAQPLFDGWIGAVRREMADAARALGAAMLARPLPPATHLAVLARMIEADPHDADLHRRRLGLLAASGDRDQLAQAGSAARRLVGEVDPVAAAGLAAGFAAAGRDAAAQPRPVAPETGALGPDLPGMLARVIVQPFAATGHPAIADPLAQLLQSGLTDALARFGNFRVLGTADGAGDCHVVSGSLVQSGPRVRVRCRLTDPTGQILWSDDYSREGDDLLALEDDLTAAIAAALEARIRFARANDAANAAANDVGARQPATANALFLRALAHMMGDGDFAAIESYLEQALAIDADHGLSGAYLPWAAIQTGRIVSPQSAVRYAGIARHAIHSAPDDVMVQSVGGLFYLLLSHDFDGALAVIERALTRQPHFAFPWLARGWVRIHAGDSAGALADFDRAEALSLADPTDNGINAGRALACYQVGDLDAARAWVQRALARSRTSLEAMRVGIAAAVEQGRLDDARAMAQGLLARNPGERASRSRIMPFRHPGVSDRFYAAYTAAGIPD